MAEGGEKTEEATPGRLEDAREKGQVAVSREFANFLVLLGLGLAFYFSGKNILDGLFEVFRLFFSNEGRFSLETSEDFVNIASFIVKQIMWMLSPVFFFTCLFGIVAYVSQFGFLFTSEKLSPDISKLNVLAGIKRMFELQTFVEFLKAVLKLAVVSFILFLMFKGELTRLNEIGAQPLEKSFVYFLELLGRIFLAMLIFTAVLGIVDFSFQKWNFAKRMMMSWNEVKEEMKQREGDPQIKARIRQIQRDRARKRMMEDVPTADVVVTNPTHVAVALKYQKGKMKAPKVVAKGAGFIAVKIKELAINSGVPVVEKRELARHLYKNIEVGESIPESLYTAVAEVLAYVYRIKRQLRSYLSSSSVGVAS